jgi:iron complex outermembrane recepter protein
MPVLESSNRARKKNTAILSLILVSLYLHYCFAQTAFAAEAQFNFTIPIQPLRQSLIEIGDITGASLVYPSALIEFKMGHQVNGQLSLDAALDQLLKDSSIHFNRGKSGIYTFYRSPQSDNFLNRFFSQFNRTDNSNRLTHDHEDTIEEIVTVGSRSKRHHARDLTVAVDVLSSEDFTQSHHLELGKRISSLAPSFNFPISTQSDGTDAFRPSTLRGLAPDQLLVLINGKRRHQSALLHTSNTVGRGTTGTDFNAIPTAAIKNIEILRDGAAALYGSDAIAGVINIELKDDRDSTEITFERGQTSAGDGDSEQFSLAHSATVREKGFIHGSLSYSRRHPTNRANLNADCIFANSCTEISNDTFQSLDLRELNANRDNYRIGDSEFKQLSAAMNISIPLSDHVDIYGNLLWSQQDHITAGFFRSANDTLSNPIQRYNGDFINQGEAYRPHGFLPLINTLSEDRSFSIGIAGNRPNTWNWDVNVSFGENDFEYHIKESLNASLVSFEGQSPSSAFAGNLYHSLFTVDLNLRRIMPWGSIATGALWRQDSYHLQEGEELSYYDYDTVNGGSLGQFDASRGIQVFPGYTPDNATRKDRTSQAIYFNSEWDITSKIQLASAVRFEHFTDIGNHWSFKASASYQLTPSLKIRAGANTGFRAPSLQQQFYSDLSNQFIVLNDQLQQVRVATIDQQKSDSLGLQIKPLKEETSINTSLGLVFSPTDNWSASIDLYNINIQDRIVISNIMTQGMNDTLDLYLHDIGADAAHVFFNGIDTRTQGIDISSQYYKTIGDTEMTLSLSANYNKTRILDYHSLGVDAEFKTHDNSYFSSQNKSIIEEWQPNWRGLASATFSRRQWQLKLEAEGFGSYAVEESNGDRQRYSGKTLVNLNLSYQFQHGLTLALGANNIFDETPERNNIGQKGKGKIIDGNSSTVIESPGVFQYSRRTTPFGFNGAYYFLNISKHWD